THGLGLTFLIDDSLGRHHAFYGAGYEVQAFRPAAGVVSAYGLLGVALGLSTDTARQELAAQWSVGGGVEWRLFSRLGIDVESRYRVEDRGPRGFWNPREARKGFSISAGLTMRLGSGRASGPSGRAPYLPPAEPPATIAGGAADVVRTALDAIGSPHQWGGTAANGFDCSGLVQ